MKKFSNSQKYIIMKYPSISNNPLCDGNEHQIKPTNLFEFEYNGRTFYYMVYDDITMRMEASTILERIGNAFYKRPLRS